MIDWHAFTWEAFATLVTGLAAVIGAVWIGLRQVAITRRQTKIADRQTSILAYQAEIADLAVRSDLFERRFEVYDRIDRFLTEASTGKFVREVLFDASLLSAQRTAKLIFPPQVYDGINELWQKAYELSRANRTADDNYPDGILPDELISTIGNLVNWLAHRQDTLPELFGNELRIWRANTMPVTTPPASASPADR